MLGRGHFTDVYLYKNLTTQLNIAVKQVKFDPDINETESQMKELKNEIDRLAELSHDRIIKLLGSHVDKENCIFSVCLEYMLDGSLFKLLRSGPLDLETTIQYTQQLLEGVEYLHIQQVIHRDIKGRNILLANKNNIKLADFGISKKLETLSATHGAQTKGIGTIKWMAPEIFSEETKYGKKVDIWSVGCTVVEMLTTHPPWHDFSDMAAIKKIIGPNQYPTYELPAALCKEVEEFLQSCFRRDPTKRPSAQELLSANLFKVPEPAAPPLR